MPKSISATESVKQKNYDMWLSWIFNSLPFSLSKKGHCNLVNTIVQTLIDAIKVAFVSVYQANEMFFTDNIDLISAQYN